MAAQQQMNPAQINALARSAIKANSIRMEQLIQSVTVTPSTQSVITLQPRNVGLIFGFWLQVQLTVSNGSAVQINLTDLGPANALSSIVFNDLDNITRHQVPGWAMHFNNTCKLRSPFGAAFVRQTGFDSPINYGSNFASQISAPATIAPAGTGIVNMWYWIPVAYSEDDMRGAIYANVIQSTMQLIVTLCGNNGVNVAVDNGKDSTLAMYVGNVAGSTALVTCTSATLNLTQVYRDQLPRLSNGQILLPVTDLATIYELKQTVVTGFVANQDFPYSYSNFRDFLSTTVIYNGNPGTNAGRGNGTDINTFALQSANQSNIWKKAPALIALQTRNVLGVDLPPGCYYFGSRERPINTNQFGNMQLVVNPITATTTNGVAPYMLVATEDFALKTQLVNAQSLAAS